MMQHELVTWHGKSALARASSKERADGREEARLNDQDAAQPTARTFSTGVTTLPTIWKDTECMTDEGSKLRTAQRMAVEAAELNCKTCVEGEAVFFLPDTEARVSGHIYSHTGRVLHSITGECEYHYDNRTAELMAYSRSKMFG